ncbi:MAG TPA: glycosyltransferase, partial [Bacteroidia bacterium]|nr:glycosyltransferase [Bacteroidia bacterium]
DVVILSNALLLGLARRIKNETGAAVACTLQGEDTFLDSLPEPDRSASWETIAQRAADIDTFIAVSRYHADLMTRRAKLAPEKVHVVYNPYHVLGGKWNGAECVWHHAKSRRSRRHRIVRRFV